MSIGDATGESLSREGDGFLLQNIMLRKDEEIVLCSKINVARQRLDILSLEIDKLEAAMRLKHRDGANIIYARVLVRVPTKRDGPLASIHYESFEKVP